CLETEWLDPRRQEILEPEFSFEVEIKEAWAYYDYIIKGQKINGYLKIRGTVDLITKENDDTLHVVDYKTGQGRKNWATGKVKEQADFEKDEQLMLYYWAIRKKFPQYKNIIMTIY